MNRARLPVAVVLALLLHGLLLGMEMERGGLNSQTAPKPRTVTMSLGYRQPEQQVEQAAVRQRNRPRTKVAAKPVKTVKPGPSSLRAEKREPVAPDRKQQHAESAGDRYEQRPAIVAAPSGIGTGATAQNVRLARPLYRLNPRPVYPMLARKRRYQGTVILEVLVADDGNPSEVRVCRSSGHGVLDRAAMEAVRQWQFEPGAYGARNSAMWVRVPVRFQLQ